ncbi:MAG: NADH:ubiquinone reductase (Na(+)-transporting) subunit B [Flavobacteriales bacterium]|nr:NADH:ubiquinone reductase (Na(+)-transporting) subunit B [Flavobacteriales bacterium]
MKALHKFLTDKIEPHFVKGGKLEKIWPVYDGFATFLFVPGHATHKGAHIRDAIDLKRTMIMVVLAMVPALLFGMFNVGHQHYLATGESAEFMDKFLYGAIKVLPIVIVSYSVGLGVEFLFCIIKKHSINEGFLVSGMLIPLILPADIPLWMVAVATIFAVVIGKEVFGGTGMNILNVALVARAFLFFAYPTYMSGDMWVGMDNRKGYEVVKEGLVDGYTGATNLAQAADASFAGHFRNVSGVGYENTFIDSFLGLIPGSIGETSTLAILLGGLFLVIIGVGSWRIMLSVFTGAYVMGLIFNLVAGDNAFMAMPAHYHLVFGGLAFGAVFMATDPVSAAQTNLGKVIYGFGIGVLCILIRVVNPAYPEGMMLAILFFNVMAPLIDYYVVQGNIKSRVKRLKLATNGNK